MYILLSLLGIIALFFALVFIIGWAISAPRYQGAVSEHFNGKHFFNPSGMNARNGGDVVKWQTEKREKKVWHKVPNFEYGEKLPPSVSEGIKVTFIGHATVLLQFGGYNIITDPVWYNRCSPVQWAGPQRVVPAGIRFDDLPKIDLIIQSHNHWDHLDIRTMQKLYKRDVPTVVCPLGVDLFLNKRGIKNTIALDWGQNYQFASDLEVTCTPAQHFSGRGLRDRNATLWASFMLTHKTEGNIWFGGDTGYNPTTFKKIGEQFGKVRFALIPIGAFKPEWFMGTIHCTPEQAVQIHKDICAEKSLAIHHSTFPLADDAQDEPQKRLDAQKKLEKNIDFEYLAEGKSLFV